MLLILFHQLMIKQFVWTGIFAAHVASVVAVHTHGTGAWIELPYIFELFEKIATLPICKAQGLDPLYNIIKLFFYIFL